MVSAAGIAEGLKTLRVRRDRLAELCALLGPARLGHEESSGASSSPFGFNLVGQRAWVVRNAVVPVWIWARTVSPVKLACGLVQHPTQRIWPCHAASRQAGGVPPKLLIIDDGWQRSDVEEQYRRAGAWQLPGSCAGVVAGHLAGNGLGSPVLPIWLVTLVGCLV
jgi:hypothetical protein